MVELILGILIAILTIVVIKRQNAESWFFSLSLLFLPLIYMIFAVFADVQGVIFMEFLYGIPYFIVGIICLTYGFKYSAYIVTALWMCHGFYDLGHSLLFNNSGVPYWYPLLCLGFDIVMSFYLILIIRKSDNSNIKTIGLTA